MKIGKPSDDRIQVKIITSTRDPKTGKMKYVTENSIDVFEATAAQVLAALQAGLAAASKK